MKRFKRMILGMIFTKRERVMIWNALWFSNHTYRRRGNVDAAANVQAVMDRIGCLIVPKGKMYSEDEVMSIIDDIVKTASDKTREIVNNVANREFRRGYKQGSSETLDIPVNVGTVIDKEKCESCTEKADCSLYSLIFKDGEGSEDSSDKSENHVEGKKEEGEEK